MREKLTDKQKHLRALRWAVGEAEAWRGSLVGSDGSPESNDDEAHRLRIFDKKVAAARAALKALWLEH